MGEAHSTDEFGVKQDIEVRYIFRQDIKLDLDSVVI